MKTVSQRAVFRHRGILARFTHVLIEALQFCFVNLNGLAFVRCPCSRQTGSTLRVTSTRLARKDGRATAELGARFAKASVLWGPTGVHGRGRAACAAA